MTQLFSYLATTIEERVAERGRPVFGTILKTWTHIMFLLFHFHYLIRFLESKIPYHGYLMRSGTSVKSVPTSLPFMLTYIDVSTAQFSRLLILIGQFGRTGRKQGYVSRSSRRFIIIAFKMISLWNTWFVCRISRLTSPAFFYMGLSLLLPPPPPGGPCRYSRR